MCDLRQHVEEILQRVHDPARSVDATQVLERLGESADRLNYLYTLLMVIGTSPSFDYRLASAILFKNQMKPRGQLHWGSSEGTSIPPDHPQCATIRSILLQLLNTPLDTRISPHLDIAISLMSTHDYPHHWKELLPHLISQPGLDVIIIRQHVDVMVSMMEEPILSYQKDKREALISASWDLVNFSQMQLNKSLSLYKAEGSSVALSLFRSSQSAIQLVFQRDLIPEGEGRVRYLNVLSQYLEGMIPFITEALEKEDCSDICDSFCKFALDFQSSSPDEFVPFVQNFLEFSFSVLLHDETEIPEDSLISSIHFFHQVLDSPAYRGGPHSSSQGQAIVQNFFSSETTSSLASILISKFMVITSDEISSWGENSEKFANDELQRDWSSDVKSAAQLTFSTLMSNFATLLVPFVTSLLENSLKGVRKFTEIPDAPGDDIVEKEACYWCLSNSPDQLNGLPIEDGLLPHLLADIQRPDTRYKIVRRRICQVIASWAPVVAKFRFVNLKPIVDSLLTLSTGTRSTTLFDDDYAIRLSDPLEAFIPYLGPIVKAITDLITASKEANTIQHLFSAVNGCVRAFRAQIVPFTEGILTCTGNMWKSQEGREGGEIMQASIITCWKNLIEVLGLGSVVYYSFFIEAVMQVTGKGKQSQLREDVLQLWLTLITGAPLTFKPDREFSVEPPREVNEISETYDALDRAFPRISQLMEDETVLPVTLDVLSAYFFRYPSLFLAAHGEFLLVILSKFLESTGNPQSPSADIKMYRTILKIIDGLTVYLGQKNQLSILDSIYTALITIVMRSDWDETLEFQEIHAATSLSRLCLMSQAHFLSLFSRPSQGGASGSDLLNLYLEHWLNRIAPCVFEMDALRIQGFAFTSLLYITSSVIANHIVEILQFLAYSHSQHAFDADTKPSERFSELEWEIFKYDPAIVLSPSFVSTRLNDVFVNYGAAQALQAIPMESSQLITHLMSMASPSAR
ncbi:hypothetical protein PROFUN_02934 [Planoprotostelium fungivorum]|uniref:Importin N-terminal domain-containing protein n=1 Tax=Planoprotostelium fungivorum TaxID=1890364 RepID=A0A2P6NS51_9EUKA|nr:hypothetical protein PROFUN_12999 [Planoprotostelium fungivorum]PRP86785.1 hypothetical protein PROFUN_02934 [Planoprotostelium fungivorum]